MIDTSEEMIDTSLLLDDICADMKQLEEQLREAQTTGSAIHLDEEDLLEMVENFDLLHKTLCNNGPLPEQWKPALE